MTTNEIMEREKLKKKEIVSLKGKNKLLPDYDKLLANKYVPEQHDIFNMFSPEKGVKFYDNGREKRGAYFDNASTASFIDGSLVSHTGAQIRLTKEEYHNITHDGMLRRKSDVQTFSNQKNTSKTEDSYKDILNDNSREEGGAKKSKYTKILSPELLESLTADNNNDQSVIKLPAIMQHSFSYSKPIQKSPIDNFNIEILKNKDWGKPGMVGALSSPPNLPKNKKEIAKGLSYAQLAKLPRERHLNMKTKHHEEGHN